jgi:hypothetical protein
MRKRSAYKPKHKSAPMLICRGLVNDELEIRERMAIQSFADGFATIDSFDTLADMHGVLLLASSTKTDSLPLFNYCQKVVSPVIQGIKDRYDRTNKFGCTGDELKVLRGFVGKYKAFWMGTSLSLYESSVKALQNEYRRMMLEEDRKAA